MQSEEQRLIDGLFGRLKEAETKTGPQDLEAEQQINQHIREQPSAPYYMAQAMIIQEAALKQMDQRVKELEAGRAAAANRQRPTEQRRLRPACSAAAAVRQTRVNSIRRSSKIRRHGTTRSKGATHSRSSQPMPNRSRRHLRAPAAPGGALQTAAGVAGGVVLADMLTGMFRHSQPQEIVNIIEENPAPLDDSAMRNFDASNNLDTFNNGDGGSFLNQDNGFQNANYQMTRTTPTTITTTTTTPSCNAPLPSHPQRDFPFRRSGLQ